ncbi:uroporphyrin-III C-methyltransferase [Legionella beliardensis]|uniref:Uroporphyrin-III C-methyltransferase n=1 Tax=Legionella beliardensis TaxID=91822 RepID=A0A378I581_9GAMM|nr:uroporphyrinogen-III C-methyltransferase [Legionella beliardensis]STX29885.1 uroporphyrin-III C-methyltransferase [Legionella beliardensis]
MNNNEEKINETTTTTKEPLIEASTPAEIRDDSKKPRVKNWWHIGLLILVFLSLLLAAFAFYQNWHLKEAQKRQQKYLNHQITALKKQLNKASTTVSTSATKLKGIQANLNNRLSRLDNNLQSALKQRFFQNQDWLLLKARYYLELVQLNAHWGDDQRITTALLQQADEILQEVPEQQLFPVRQAIAQEITKLNALPKVDVAGLLSQLDAAQALVLQLPLQQNLINDQLTTPTPTTTSSGWKGKLDNSLSYLKKLVIVRRHEGDAQPLYSPLHQALLRETIRMNLQEAQWAILQKNTQVYKQALTQAITAIKNTFDNQAVNTQALLKQLQELQQQRLVYPRPVVDEPLVLLNQYIASRTKPHIPAAPTSATGDKS